MSLYRKVFLLLLLHEKEFGKMNHEYGRKKEQGFHDNTCKL